MIETQRAMTDEEREYYSLSSRVYAKLAPFYDPITLPLKKLRQEVVFVAGIGANSKVLDVATGTGVQAFAFAPHCREVVGVDLSEAMLRIARRKNRHSNVTFYHADATRLPFDDGSFDASCVSFALHEMPRTIADAVLAEMRRVTKPGGRFIVVDYALPHNAIGRFLVYHVVKVYERDLYAKFIHSDLRATLQTVGIGVREEHRAFLGMARIIAGVSLNAAMRIDERPHEQERAGCVI
jgi:ubiquinone/menaquinone biosynthesis C-methylase UbiE